MSLRELTTSKKHLSASVFLSDSRSSSVEELLPKSRLIFQLAFSLGDSRLFNVRQFLVFLGEGKDSSSMPGASWAVPYNLQYTQSVVCVRRGHGAYCLLRFFFLLPVCSSSGSDVFPTGGGLTQFSDA